MHKGKSLHKKNVKEEVSKQKFSITGTDSTGLVAQNVLKKWRLCFKVWK